MRLSRDKVNKLAHAVADALTELDQVEFIEDPNTIRMEARRILEELRRRLADPQRPQIELDYIERLLKDY